MANNRRDYAQGHTFKVRIVPEEGVSVERLAVLISDALALSYLVLAVEVTGPRGEKYPLRTVAR